MSGTSVWAEPSAVSVVGVTTTTAILSHTDVRALNGRVVQLVNGVIHSIQCSELGDSCSSVSDVDIDNFTTTSHCILQCLPAHIAGQSLDNDSVIGAHWRRRSTIVSAPSALGNFDAKTMASEGITIECTQRILGITRMIELDESESLLEFDTVDATIVIEKTVHISFKSIKR